MYLASSSGVSVPNFTFTKLNNKSLTTLNPDFKHSYQSAENENLGDTILIPPALNKKKTTYVDVFDRNRITISLKQE